MRAGSLVACLALLAAACLAQGAETEELIIDPPAPAPADTASVIIAPPETTAVPAAPEVAAPEAAPAGAVPDSGDLVIEVDKSQSRNKDKSLALAMLYSAVLPGAGELYLGEKNKAKAFLLVETGFWASLYVAVIAKQSYLESARHYASHYGGIDASAKSEAFLETMADFRSYQEKQHRQDSYELAQVLSGKREQDYDIKPLPENYWDFGSASVPQNTENWRTFQSTLRYYRASKVAMSFAIGALALNRLASIVNTLADYKRTSAQGLGLDITPDFGPHYAGTRLTLRF